MSGDNGDVPSATTAPESSASSSPPSSSSPATPSAEELSRVARQEALMDRLMERKLALLEADYAETLNAEARANARAAGYSAALNFSPTGEGEWSSAWTQFKADMEEEQRREEALNLSSDDDTSAAPSSSAPPTLLHAPLTPAKISAIRSHMATIRLRPPPWAVGLSEEVWMARILERAGFARRAPAAAEAESKEEKSHAPGEEDAEAEAKRRRRARRKAKKARQQRTQAGQAAQAAPTASGAEAKEAELQSASDGFSEFEASFPSLPVAVGGPTEDSKGGQ